LTYRHNFKKEIFKKSISLLL